MTQKQLILEHLRCGYSLTVAEALSQYGIYALSQRVGELKREGFEIVSETVELPSGKHVARYRLGLELEGT